MQKLNKYIKEFQQIASIKEYDEILPLIQKMESYLIEVLKEKEDCLDYILILASVQMELRKTEENSIKLIETFLEKYETTLTKKEKSRAYTDLAFYYRESFADEKEIDILKKAESFESEYPNTFFALANYFYENRDYQKAEYYLEKILEKNSDFKYMYSYASLLFCNKKYKEAKKIFQTLEKENFRSIKSNFAIIFCDIKLGSKKQALEILEKLISYENIKDDYDFELASAYYNLEAYDKCISVYKKNLDDFVLTYLEEYFYSLYAENKIEELENLVEKELISMKSFLKECEEDLEESEEERQESISYHKEEIEKFEAMIENIKKGNKPSVDLIIHPMIHGCYLIDCIRHRLND